MRRRVLILILATVLAGSALSCATGGLTPSANPMPAARAGLPPDERFFYDALADYGDWALLEPYGWVFQPRVNWLTWRPYQYGFWAPTDLYGWTWISSEPFGWATFHYGQWTYDRFLGWVWIPGLDWGPAWVSWRESEDYVGWAPLMPQTSQYESVPGGAYLYVPPAQLVSTDIAKHAVKQESIRNEIGRMSPVTNFAEAGDVKIVRGPAFEDIERAVGAPIPRVTLDDRSPVTAGDAGSNARTPRPGGTAAENAAAMRRAAEEAARQARDLSATPTRVPEHVPVLRRIPRRPANERGEGRERKGGERPAGPDSSGSRLHAPKPAARDTSR